MPAALIQANAIAGPFTASYAVPGAGPLANGTGGTFNTLGIIGPEGIRLLQQRGGEPINSDQYGKDTILNGVHTGSNVFVEFRLQEANLTTAKQIAYPWSQSAPGWGLEEELGTIGSLWTANAGSLKLSPIASTNAHAEATPVRVFGIVILAPGHGIDVQLRAGLKSFPIRLLCLPYDAGSGVIKFYNKVANA